MYQFLTNQWELQLQFALYTFVKFSSQLTNPQKTNEKKIKY